MIFLFDQMCLSRIIEAYKTVGLLSFSIKLAFAQLNYNTAYEYQDFLSGHYTIYSYMPDSTINIELMDRINKNSGNQIPLNNFVFYGSTIIQTIANSYINRGKFIDIGKFDKKTFRYILYKYNQLGFTVGELIDTTNVLDNQFTFAQYNNHLTLSKIQSYSISDLKNNYEYPYFGPPIITFQYNITYMILLIICLSINIIINISFIIFITLKRRSRIMRKSFISFCYSITISSMSLSLSAFFSSLIPTSVSDCRWSMNCFGISIYLFISTLFTKIIRVHRILNNSAMIKVKISKYSFIINLLSLLSISLIYVIIWNYGFPPKYINII